MTGDGHRTVTPAEHDSEAQPGGPEEAGAHQVLFGSVEASWDASSAASSSSSSSCSSPPSSSSVSDSSSVGSVRSIP